MSTPRSRPSAAVYRRRRLVVLGGLLLVILAIVLLIWQPWNAGGAEDPKPKASTSAQPTVAATGEAPPDGTEGGEVTATDPADPAATDAPAITDPPPIAACEPNTIKVEAVTDKTEYAAGEVPQLSMRLTNSGAVDCTIDVGTAVQTFTITSGSDTWWRSTDCQANPTNQIVTLPAGQTVDSAAGLGWDRTRSSVSSCEDPNRPQAGAGGASYHLTVTLAGIPSEGTAYFMLF